MFILVFNWISAQRFTGFAEYSSFFAQNQIHSSCFTFTTVYHLDQKVLGLVTVWRSRSADFNSLFFCYVGRSVIDGMSDFQLDSLTFVYVTLYCVYLSLCVVSIFHKKKKCHQLCSNKFVLNFVLKMDLTVRRLWKCWRSVSATIF